MSATLQNRRHTYYGGTVLTSPPSGSSNHHSTSTNIHMKPQYQSGKFPSFGPYMIGSTLGQGEFGKVKLGWSKVNKNKGKDDYTEISKQVAIKLIRRDTLIHDKTKEVKIFREINALKQLHHPNIVKLDEVLQNSKYIGIVLEYASGGEFYKYIQKKKRLKEQISCKLFAQLISGVNYIHSKGLVHRDLKLENLLLDKNENLIITDFGFVNEYYSHNEMMETSCGSPCYAAPELVVSNKPYEARKADIWSCGIILFAMLAGYLPWDDDYENPDGEDIARLYYYIIHTPLKFPDYISPLPRDLLRRILVVDPRKRVTLDKIETHSWLSSYKSFMSITSTEWDNLAESRDVLRVPKHSKQYSQRPNSTCSMSSTHSRNNNTNNNNSSSNKSSKENHRNSLIMDNTLFAFPAPPREYQSHVLAIPSSPSPELRSVRSRSPIKLRGHNRSNSAASLALQAVVDADISITNNNNNNHNNHNNHNNNNNNNNIHNIHKTTQDGDNIIMTPLSIIEPTNNNTNQQVSPLSKSGNKNNTASPLSNHIGLNTSTIQRNNNSKAKIYHSSNHRKPRPTSYYPGLIPESEGFSSSSYSSISITPLRGNRTQRSDSIIIKSPFDSVPNLGTDTAVTSIDEEFEDDIKTINDKRYGSASPKLLHRRTSSTFSKASIDKEVNINGDIMKMQNDIESIIKKVSERVVISEEPVKRSRRYSMFAPVSVDMATTSASSSSQARNKSGGAKNRYSSYITSNTRTVTPPPVIIEDEPTSPTYESINVLAPPRNSHSSSTATHASRAKRVIDFFKRKSVRV
ncbi:fatty acyl-CoA synthetase and RNA processing-associated kinase 1 [Monosporozyma servazzii]